MRRRSHWAWGWADRFPDRDARRAIGEQVRAITSFDVKDVTEPVALDAITMPAPRIDAPPSLAAITSIDHEDRALHTRGRSYRDVVRGFYGDFASAPDLVMRPRDEREVDAILDWASSARVAVVPFGGGTSVVGGVEMDERRETYAGVVSLDLGAMTRVLEVDATSRAARIQAGATGPQLEAQLAQHGMSMRCYPQSFEHSTLGGWIATRAGGHFATVYTHVDDLVESMRVVTPRGLIETRRLPASGAGPSPDRLMLGSEGIFGVITDAWVRVQVRPTFRASASVKFTSYERAVDATRAIAQSGLFPSNCRLLDQREAMMNGVAMGASVLVLGFESADHPLEAWMERALSIAREHGGESEGATYRSGAGSADDAAGRWRQAFLDAPYLQSSLVSLGMIADTFETACTWDRFATLHAAVVRAVRDASARVCGAKALVSCRFTHVYPDGPAPYYTFVAPATRGRELEQWTEIKRAASDALMAHGATITHHHAVGRLHRPWYEQERPSLFEHVLRATKRELDPAGILNPGVLLA
ncbi:FAD-binding oxidoreductase [Sandaracinus amylolyticus]|uniref:Alkyldihydroxyacetonephosphate synthase n=1 Tax=Sandaracinus amylolyticus TaxID=927083 RepID=A0A0F6VZ42_9BACT|nr:FAD-binding oxidoreductase [Sandaracinus amylolyticus]AKF03325.1 Alkyldihydroxyacetonephosphate synthase [Sandaracinus amylolyticus]